MTVFVGVWTAALLYRHLALPLLSHPDDLSHVDINLFTSCPVIMSTFSFGQPEDLDRILGEIRFKAYCWILHPFHEPWFVRIQHICFDSHLSKDLVLRLPKWKCSHYHWTNSDQCYIHMTYVICSIHVRKYVSDFVCRGSCRFSSEC